MSVAGVVARGLLVLLLAKTTWWMLGNFDMAAIGAIGPNADPPTFVFRILSGANLIFHEAGHALFGAFGRFLQVLGGSMLEVAVPWICGVALLRSRRDTFGAVIAAWWGGETLVGLGPYIYDASEQVQPLLGGVIGQDRPGYHDWNNFAVVDGVAALRPRYWWPGDGDRIRAHAAGVRLELLAAAAAASGQPSAVSGWSWNSRLTRRSRRCGAPARS